MRSRLLIADDPYRREFIAASAALPLARLLAGPGAALLAAACTSTAYRNVPFARFAPLMYEARAPGGGRILLFGALHVGTDRFYPLPDRIEAGYREADRVAIEIDAAAHWDELVAGFRPRVHLPAGVKLADLIDASLLDEVRAFFGFDEQQWQQMQDLQPWWIASFRFATGDDRAMQSSGDFGSERFFLQRARTDGKPVIELESPTDQVTGLSGGEFDEQREQFAARFDVARRRGGMMRELIAAWRAGDALAIEAMKSSAWGDARHLAGLRRRAFTDRDTKMAQRLAREIRSGDTLFATIGVFHLVGDDSVVARLPDHGLSVRLVDTLENRMPAHLNS
jgi:uncharacterized protein